MRKLLSIINVMVRDNACWKNNEALVSAWLPTQLLPRGGTDLIDRGFRTM